MDNTVRNDSQPAEGKTPVNTDIQQQQEIIAAMPPPRFTVVAIGASAGGLSALTELLLNLSPNLGAVYIIVQHLLPGHESILPELLNRKTEMPVHQVENGMKIQPDNVYVMPPDAYMSIVDGHLTLGPRQENNGNHSIDYFLEALAYVYKTKAIAVILSGTGTDGTEGISYIKAEGGITFAQDNSAAFQGMPQSAVGSGFTDFVLPAGEIGEMLEKILKVEDKDKSEFDLVTENAEELNKIHKLLLQKRGVDFKLYKQSTINRRILRRMKLNRLPDLQSYTSLLHEVSDETDQLYKDLLINVTSFFREPMVYEALSKIIFPALLTNRRPNDPVRMWIPACSSGEEPYSIAICLYEYLKDKAISTPVQIYATDLSEQAIDKARAGVYHHSTLQNISPERLKKYFIKLDGSYQIIKAIRDVCVFANHNLLKDPPFSRMDIISCQNVMIYLDAIAQRKILMSFNYALKPSGYLTLGKSETVSSAAELFEQLDKDAKIYTKKSPPPNTYFNFSAFSSNAAEAEIKHPNDYLPLKNIEIDVEKEADKLLLSQYSPASVLVNKNLQILRFYGSAFPFLQPSSGKASLSLLKMVREELVYDVRSLLLSVKQNGNAAKKENILIEMIGVQHTLSIEAVYVKSPAADRCMLVIFTLQKTLPAANIITIEQTLGKRRNAKDKRISFLEEELRAAKDYMKSISEEYEAAKEELQSANEEILSSIEELQSINEELETSKEELQSANEELTTVNEELQLRNNDLKELVEYTDSIVQTINQALVVLHPDMRIRSANKSFNNLFGLNADEAEGAYLYEIGNGLLNIPQLRSELESSKLKNNGFYNFEIDYEFRQRGRKILVMNAMRMSAESDKRARILLAIEDVTERRKAEETKNWLAAIVSTSSEGIISFTEDFIILSWNKGAEDIYGYTAEDLVGKSLQTLTPAEKKGEPEMIVEQVKQNGILKQFETIRKKKNGELIFVELTVSALKNDKNNVIAYTKLVRDISKRKATEAKLHQSSERFKAIVNQSTAFVAEMDTEGKFIFANQAFSDITGYTCDELLNTTMNAITHPEDQQRCREMFEETAAHGNAYADEKRIIHKDGSVVWINSSISALRNEENKTQSVVAVAIDVSEKKRSEGMMRQWEERYRIALEAGGLGAWDWNLVTNKVIWNEQHFTLLGLTPQPEEELEPHDFLKHLHPDDAEYVKKQLDIAIHITDIYQAQFRIIKADDKAVRWMMGYGRIVKKEEGKAVRITGVMYDITDIKVANDELKSAQASLNIALEASKMGVWDLDLKTMQAKRSLRHDRLLGYETLQEEWNAEKAKAHLVAGDKQKFEEAIANMNATGKFDLEVRVQHSNGSVCWVHYFGNVFYNEHHEPLQAAGVIYDITDRKSIETQKDEFIGIASHELKTPVTSIKAYAEILYDNFITANDQQNLNFISKMNGQIDRLTHLIKDLLDVTKISGGKLLLNVSAIGINQLLQDTANDIQIASPRHTITLDLHELPHFKGDKDRLRQVFINLLSNAVKYSPDANKVIIRTNRIDNKINVSVQDFGMGMSADTQSKLFERFFRAGDANIATFPGLGLGLYISMEIIKQHKGTIRVQSERGKGSVFTVELPLPQEQ